MVIVFIMQQLNQIKEKVHIIVDDREHKLKALLDNKKDTITYESRRLDVADIVVTEETGI
ncbi:hypothetical protein LCGC14_3136240, partial [marine sediment metagenome]